MDAMYPTQTTQRIYGAIRPDLRVYRLGGVRERSVLVIEDDSTIWPLIERAAGLVDPPLALDFVGSPEEAIDRMMQARDFDLVLVDDCLPTPGDGRALRTSIESLQPWAGMAMMSGYSSGLDWDAPFLPKPFSTAQCEAFLEGLLG